MPTLRPEGDGSFGPVRHLDYAKPNRMTLPPRIPRLAGAKSLISLALRGFLRYVANTLMATHRVPMRE